MPQNSTQKKTGLPKNQWCSEVRRVLNLQGNNLLLCAQRFSNSTHQQSLERAIELLNQTLNSGNKIILSGVGKSGKIAQKVAATLSSTGSLAIFLHPTEGLHGDIGVLAREDVVIALSQTGNTDELIRLLPSFKNRGIKVIALTSNSQSKLATAADVWLDTSVTEEACPLQLAPTTSTTLALALGDALAVTLMQVRGFDESAFALNHPGGSLGKRLNLKVADIMHSGEALALCTPEASTEEILEKLTKKKLGAVLVSSDGTLAGIITDGDVRRALKHKNRFFDFTANEIMTKNPSTISSNSFAQEALNLMENRPSQIAVLPVVDDQNRILGLVRLHDLVQSL